MNWISMMDELKAKYELTSDAELARMIGATPNDVWQARARDKKLPAYSRWQLLDRLGFVKSRDMLFTAMAWVVPASLAAEITESHNRLIRETAASAAKKDIEALRTELKKLAKLAIDHQLTNAEFSAFAEQAFADEQKLKD